MAKHPRFDLNLLYSGGSGGFVLLHFLLLSDRFEIALANNKNISNSIQQQWQITNASQWKKYEVWPDNAATSKLRTNKRRIYFFCNPNQYSDLELESYCHFNVALYVDYASQLKLAYYKKAWIYEKQHQCAQDPKFTEIRRLLRNWKDHYTNIKDPSWPKYVPIKKLNSLSAHIKDELLQNPYTHDLLKYEYRRPTLDFNGQEVFNTFSLHLPSADVAIKLQDFINSRGQTVVESLKLPPVNDQQLKLIEHWCSLHPKELLADIGINI